MEVSVDSCQVKCVGRLLFQVDEDGVMYLSVRAMHEKRSDVKPCWRSKHEQVLE